MFSIEEDKIIIEKYNNYYTIADISEIVQNHYMSVLNRINYLISHGFIEKRNDFDEEKEPIKKKKSQNSKITSMNRNKTNINFTSDILSKLENIGIKFKRFYRSIYETENSNFFLIRQRNGI